MTVVFPTLPTFSYVRNGWCYTCGNKAPLFRWDDYDESSELICHNCAAAALEKLKEAESQREGHD